MYSQLEKWSLNNKELLAAKHIVEEPDDKTIFTSATKRPLFTYNDSSVTIPAIFLSLIGVKGDIEEYNAFLFDMNERLASLGSLYTRVETPLDKRFEPDLLNKMQKAWQPFGRAQDAKSSDLVDSFVNSGAVRMPADKNMKKHLASAMVKTLDFYKEQKDYRFFENKNILFHIVFWYNKYCSRILDDFDFTGNNPTVMFWGALAKRELYFAYFLRMTGSDVICISGTEDKTLEEFSGSVDFVSKFSFPRQIELTQFPTERPAAKLETVTRQHSDQLRDTLHSDDSFCYKPWQFIDYAVRPLTMRTTIDEISILSVEKAMIRQGWEAGAGRVTIPHFFSKINGVNANQNDFWKLYNKLRTLPKAEVFETLPIVKNKIKLMKNEYFMVLNSDRVVDPDKLLKAPFWPYLQYRNHIQKLIAEKCASLCSLDSFKRVRDLPPEMQKIEIFSRMMQLPPKILQLVQTFDYPGDVPKLIVYNGKSNQMLSQDDALVIAFAASAAIDVFVFNPAGQNDIEIYLEENDIDIHHLEEMEFNLAPKTRSIMGKFF